MQRQPRLILLVLSAAIIAAGCSKATTNRQFIAFATPVSITIEGAKRAPAEAAIDRIEQEFARISRDWYAYGDGELAQVNQRIANQQNARPSDELASLILRSLQLSHQSGGTFNPLVGGLIKLWQFDRFDQQHTLTQTPEQLRIDEQIASINSGMTLSQDADGWQLTAASSHLQIDLGGIGKGAALALARNQFQGLTFERAVIDIGGDVLVIGADPKSEFRIGVADPRNSDIALTLKAFAGETIVSSGDYERFWQIGQTRYQHIIDPRSGWPAPARAATVIHADPLLADVAATALVVAGRSGFSQICDMLGISMAMLIDADGKMHVSEAMQERLIAEQSQ